MEEAEDAESRPVDERCPTAPENFTVTLRGFDTEEGATEFGYLVGAYIRELSRDIDLSGLDGITIAVDYSQALLDLDRGYETSHRLTPSDEFAIGVAMTPSVIRDGKIKSHIVLDARFVIALVEDGGENFSHALHMLAHECAHVEVTQRFDAAFPGMLLQGMHENAHDVLRWQIIFACWDEYAATLISAPYGQDPTAAYEETFIQLLGEIRRKANELIKAYRLHSDHERVMGEVYGAYGNLMKFACYHLGNMAGRGLSLHDLPVTQRALEGHWFAPYFDRLNAVCKQIAGEYGEWGDKSAFEAIGDIADEIVVEGGLIVSHLDEDSLYVDVPFSAETMP